jgi:type IX secretion system PorP/SprF family membrane protein
MRVNLLYKTKEMRKALKGVGVFLFFSFSFFSSNGQDIHFSQFNESPLTLNPALAGSGAEMRANLNYRNQWKSVTVPYQTYAASIDIKTSALQQRKLHRTASSKNYLAFGLNFFRDRAGDVAMGITQVNLSVASHIQMNSYNSITVGIQGGLSQFSANYSNVKWDNQYNGTSYDATMPSGEITRPANITYGDYTAGINWAYGQSKQRITGSSEIKANIGLAVYHIQSFVIVKDNVFPKYAVHGGFVHGIGNSKVLFAPSFMYLRQGTQQELNLGAMIKYKIVETTTYTGFKEGSTISFGGFYRNMDAIIIVAQMEYSKYAIGVSYDINFSSLNLGDSGRGGFELTLRFSSSKDYRIR